MNRSIIITMIIVIILIIILVLSSRILPNVTVSGKSESLYGLKKSFNRSWAV